MRFKHVFLIGAGGTGSHLIGPLVQLLRFHPDGTNDITIIDGDVYEDSNLNRQIFDADSLGKNKARATATRLNRDTIRTIAQFVDKEKFSEILEKTISKEDNFLVVTSVDNHATRNAIISAIDEGGYPNFVLISPGNQYASGQVVVYAKEDNTNLTTHPFDKYQDLAEPEDVIPGEGDGCAEQAVSTPQLITANMGAAWGTLLTISNMLDEKGWYEEIHFNCRRSKMVTQGTVRGVLV
jgi:molybdopterin/thiamine biosynthesis adenylyltransferase